MSKSYRESHLDIGVMVRSHQKYFAPDCPVGLSEDCWKQWVPHPIFAVRSDSREQIIIGVNEPLKRQHV